MTDRTLAIREAVVSRMRTSPGITALVPATSIFGERVPDDRAYPFIRTGEQTVLPFSLGCGVADGAYDLTIHGFITDASSDGAATLGGAVREEFEDKTLTLPDDTSMSVMWRGGGVIRDPEEPDTWHSFQNFTVV